MRIDSNEPLPILGSLALRKIAKAAFSRPVRERLPEERPRRDDRDRIEISALGQAHQSHEPDSPEALDCLLCQRDAEG